MLCKIPLFSYNTGRGKGRESTYLTKLPITSVVYGETEALIDPLGPRTCLTSPQILEDNYFGNKEIKVTSLSLIIFAL